MADHLDLMDDLTRALYRLVKKYPNGILQCNLYWELPKKYNEASDNEIRYRIKWLEDHGLIRVNKVMGRLACYPIYKKENIWKKIL